MQIAANVSKISKTSQQDFTIISIFFQNLGLIVWKECCPFHIK